MTGAFFKRKLVMSAAAAVFVATNRPLTFSRLYDCSYARLLPTVANYLSVLAWSPTFLKPLSDAPLNEITRRLTELLLSMSTQGQLNGPWRRLESEFSPVFAHQRMMPLCHADSLAILWRSCSLHHSYYYIMLVLGRWLTSDREI